jgi:hypothetical protein
MFLVTGERMWDNYQELNYSSQVMLYMHYLSTPVFIQYERNDITSSEIKGSLYEQLESYDNS